MNESDKARQDVNVTAGYAGLSVSPQDLMPLLEELRAKNKYAKDWIMRLEKKTNRHPETGGGPWGWYEIFPLGKIVGYWGTNRDDLKNCDIKEWNRLAAEISSNRS